MSSLFWNFWRASSVIEVCAEHLGFKLRLLNCKYFYWLSFTPPPLIDYSMLQLVSEKDMNHLILTGSWSKKTTWNMVLANHRSSIGQITCTRRSASQHIFRAWARRPRKFSLTTLMFYCKFKLLPVMWRAMMWITRHLMLCSIVFRSLSLIEWNILIRFMRSRLP